MPYTDVLIVGTPSSTRASLHARLLAHQLAYAEGSGVRLLSAATASTSAALEWLRTALAAAPAASTRRIVLCISGPLTHAAWCHATLPEAVAHACQSWDTDARALLTLAVASGQPLLVVRAEDDARDPDATLARAAAFTGMPVLQAAGGSASDAPATTVSPRAARAAMRSLALSDMPALLGYDIALPPLPAALTPEQTRLLAAWAEDELTIARDAAVDGDAATAVEALKTLFDYFGPAFDALGLDLDYEGLAITLTDILLSVELPGPAATIAGTLLAQRPRSLEGQRLHMLAALASFDTDGALRAATQYLRVAAEADDESTAHAPDLVRLLHRAHPDDAAVPEFFAALAIHRPMAGALQAMLSAAPEERRAPHAYAALGLLAAARGDLAGGIAVLETGLTYHSRSPEVQNALFALYARQKPDDPRFDLKGRFCAKPFENVDLLPGGGVHACCAVWQPEAMGNVYETRDWRDVWNGPMYQKMRQSILDGSYRYCNKLSCSFIQNDSLPRHEQAAADDARWEEIISEQLVEIPFAPRIVNLSYDRSCNLSCPSCRTEVLQANEPERQRMDEMTDRIVLPLLQDAELVTITGSGDPFGSKTFRRLLTRLGGLDYPNLQYNIITNGQLLTPEMWDQFPRFRERVRHIAVSVDAATPETYRKLRRGGELEKLLPNLRYIGEHREELGIEHYRLGFVVQKENFREMPAFVRLAKEVGANELQFQRLINWGTFSHEEYKDKAVCLPDHPLHAEFLEIMQDPIFEDPMLELGMLRAFMPESARFVESAVVAPV